MRKWSRQTHFCILKAAVGREEDVHDIDGLTLMNLNCYSCAFANLVVTFW